MNPLETREVILIVVAVFAAAILLWVVFTVGMAWLRLPFMLAKQLNAISASLDRIDTRMARWEASQREAVSSVETER